MLDSPEMDNQDGGRSEELAKELDLALNGTRQHLQALRQSAEWENTKKRRVFLKDLSNRLKSIIRLIDKELTENASKSSD